MTMTENQRPRPLILISNDDSINAPGLLRLIDYVNSLGDIIVVAPEEPHSGMSSAFGQRHSCRLYQTRTPRRDAPQTGSDDSRHQPWLKLRQFNRIFRHNGSCNRSMYGRDTVCWFLADSSFN